MDTHGVGTLELALHVGGHRFLDKLMVLEQVRIHVVDKGQLATQAPHPGGVAFVVRKVSDPQFVGCNPDV